MTAAHGERVRSGWHHVTVQDGIRYVDGEVWCEPDECPAVICNGPHVAHHCPNGDLVVRLAADLTPCPFCGHEGGPA